MPSADGERVLLYPAEQAPLTPARLRTLATELHAARAGLAAMPVHDIIQAIGRAVARLADPDEATVTALAASAGLHPASVRVALVELARAFSPAQIEHLLARELGSPAPLDGFAERPDGRCWTRAYGPGLAALVLAGNVYPAAAESILLCLLAKAPCLVKLPSRDPVFALHLIGALAAEEPRVARSLAAVYWPSGDHEMYTAAFGAADAVIAYGGAVAIAGVGALLPSGVRLIEHGPKLSFAVIPGEEARSLTAARALAEDVALYDQQGCLSPHTVYVLGDDGAAMAFGERLAAALAEIEVRLPRAALTPEEAAAVLQARGAAEFRTGARLLVSSGSTAWTVIVEPDTGFTLSCLNRVVYVKPLAALSALPEALKAVRPFLQSVGAGGDDAFRLAVAAVCGPLGVARICPLGRMQRPAMDWRHDGRPRLLDLLRWTDVDAAP